MWLNLRPWERFLTVGGQPDLVEEHWCYDYAKLIGPSDQIARRTAISLVAFKGN